MRASTSQKTILAPSVENAMAVETQVVGVVMTSSPGLIPAAMPASINPLVALVTANAYGTPQ